MDTAQQIEITASLLPALIQRDKKTQHAILELVHEKTLSRAESDQRFNQMITELQKNREEQSRKWDEQNRKWDEKWDEQNRKWDENQAVIEKMQKKHDSFIGALGSRWGLHTEESFREALKAILEKDFNVQVIRVNDMDEKGEVFGRPDQIELDIIISNGMTIVCEIKSSMSRYDVYAFNKKIEFYEKHHDRKVSRKIIISPMLDQYGHKLAQKLNMEVYTHSEGLKL